LSNRPFDHERLGFCAFWVGAFSSIILGNACATAHPKAESRSAVSYDSLEVRDDSLPELQPMRCELEATLRSISADVPAVVRFSNERDEEVELFWLDYDGKRKSYGPIAAKSTREQRTFLTHPWVISTLSGECIDVRVPRAPRYRVTISGLANSTARADSRATFGSPKKLSRKEQVGVDAEPFGSSGNPIRCYGPEGEEAYLGRLRCPSGRRPSFTRLGSEGEGPYETVIDNFAVSCPEWSAPKQVFMDMYHDRTLESRAPLGFSIAAPDAPAK
jgi:hypothetical protein